MLLRIAATALLLALAGCTNRPLWIFDDEPTVPVSKQFHRSRGRAVLDEDVQMQINEEIASQESPEHQAQHTE
jgi:hypothetical protein